MHTVETLIFFVFVALATYVDLFVLNKDHHEISLGEAGVMSAAWTSLSLLFSGYVFVRYGQELWMQFLAGYALEEALSIDNLFVIAVIFKAFGVKGSQQRLALSWGIIGAVAMRALLIFVGVGLVQRFHWLLPVFGFFLIFTGLKMFRDDADAAKDIKDSQVYRLASKVMPVYPGFDNDKIITVQNGKRMLTMLGMAIIMVEGTDLIFAIDSIPAVMGISTDPFIVLTSNIFAVLGLRALYFLLAGILHKFRYLKVGLAFVLIFIGGKMVALLFHVHVPTVLSLLIVLGTIAVSIVASLLIPEREKIR
ncbi:MAG TPA: TerC family protein [Symbiobacteriaceae bacterium]|jgi:tellurite resistance protein TerC|nr:TerC family protein [Symbiobacteriaceae bacterium]